MGQRPLEGGDVLRLDRGVHGLGDDPGAAVNGQRPGRPASGRRGGRAAGAPVAAGDAAGAPLAGSGDRDRRQRQPPRRLFMVAKTISSRLRRSAAQPPKERPADVHRLPDRLPRIPRFGAAAPAPRPLGRRRGGLPDPGEVRRPRPRPAGRADRRPPGDRRPGAPGRRRRHPARPRAAGRRGRPQGRHHRDLPPGRGLRPLGAAGGGDEGQRRRHPLHARLRRRLPGPPALPLRQHLLRQRPPSRPLLRRRPDRRAKIQQLL